MANHRNHWLHIIVIEPSQYMFNHYK